MIEESGLSKKCSDCGILKIKTDFHFRNINQKYGKEYAQCTNMKQKVYDSENREKINKYKKQYFCQNKDKIYDSRKKYEKRKKRNRC